MSMAAHTVNDFDVVVIKGNYFFVPYVLEPRWRKSCEELHPVTLSTSEHHTSWVVSSNQL